MKKFLTKKLALAGALLIATFFTITSVSATFLKKEVDADGCTYTGDSRGYCSSWRLFSSKLCTR